MAGTRSSANFGMDKELKAKEDAKRDVKKETEVLQFLSKLTGENLNGNLLTELKDGAVLCKAMNAVKPGSIKKINSSAMPFKQMENISNFLKACRTELNMRENDLFTTPDLFDERSPYNVMNGIINFSRAATKSGFKGPTIAPKESLAGAVKRWSLNVRNSGVSLLNMGSAGIMDRTHVSTSNDINFGAKSAGTGSNSGVSKLNQGSYGIQEKGAIDSSRDINFGAKMAGVGSSGSVSMLNNGSKGVMDENKSIDRSRNITFGADAGESKYRN